MVITILDEQSNEVVETLPAWLTEADAIKAAKEAISEAAAEGKTYIAIDEDGENALPPSFSLPAKNLNVTFEGYERDRLGDNLAKFSGVFVF